ncbi:hypothetical protein [Bacteroides sp. GM023]|uniref:hypothetical protein n=1 Tax=Bacteroides sp. GM023 TaxID=2723058 RepID=UPI00168A6F5A|nr:hypothetical protein [Bacteroides sp. GM023]MBD3588138.1 hypothetical protein [Bacteroides sp. GM023]
MNEKLNNWSEYWQRYDTLCCNIKSENNQMAEQLIDAKLYVNGLTDGWYAFLNLFKELMFKNSNSLSSNCKVQADSLIIQLENALIPQQNKYGGMTVNERLVLANKMDEFDDAINSKDIPKITDILKSVELSDSNINAILGSYKLLFI